MTSFRPFFNAATGEWITYTAIAEDSDGQLGALHLAQRPRRRDHRARPSPPGGALHHPGGRSPLHPRRREARGRTAGETIVVPAGVPHSEGNPGPAEIDGIVELRPALRAKELHEAFAGLVADGKTTPRGAPRNPLQLGATFWHFRHESRVTSPPIWVQNLMLPPLWALARAFGVRRHLPCSRRPGAHRHPVRHLAGRLLQRLRPVCQLRPPRSPQPSAPVPLSQPDAGSSSVQVRRGRLESPCPGLPTR